MISPPHLFSREDEHYVYQGNCTSADFQQLESSLYADASTILCRDLLLQADQSCLHSLDLRSMRDQGLLNLELGYSFLKDNDVAALPIVYLPHFEQRYCTTMTDIKGLQSGPVQSPSRGVPGSAAVQKYESNARVFLEYLLLLLLLDGKHPDGLSNFQSVESPDLPSLLIENSTRGPRNIMIVGGNVMISTQKNLDWRFRAITEPISKLLVLYLACVRPFLARLAPKSPTASSDFLFPLQRGHWDNSTYLNIVREQARIRVGKHLTLQDINAALVRYVEKMFPDNFSSDMREWLIIDQTRSISPVFQSWEQSLTPELLSPYGPSSPLAHCMPALPLADMPTGSFGELALPEPGFGYQPLPLATPIKHEWSPVDLSQEYGFPWTASSPSPSTSSESHPLLTPQSIPPTMMIGYGRKKCEPVIRLTTEDDFINLTPAKLAEVFRPSGNGKNHHQILFVNCWDPTDKTSNTRSNKPVPPKRITDANKGPRPAWQSAVPTMHQQIRQVPNTRGRPRRA